jgi:EAL domain-containing protein (putative c-di-GMP-specific phosphodiesterase class I)
VREQHLAEHRDSLIRDLRQALKRGELTIAYQPIVNAADERVFGVEALVRWTHPRLGTIAPETTVTLAEDAGLISDIGRWVLSTSCRQRHDLAGVHHRDLKVSVNVSAYELRDPDYARNVQRILAETDTEPKDLTLELTESVFIRDSDGVLAVLNRLKSLGVIIALDDFGTGYSSLSYLKRFPVDIVKIDRVFIADICIEPTSRLIVSAIVELAHSLQMHVVAEGVESVQQRAEIQQLDCDAYQGYLFARPMPQAELQTRLERWPGDQAAS